MALQMPEHPYGREVKAYLGSRVAVPPPWFSLGKQSGAGMGLLDINAEDEHIGVC